MTPRTTEKGRAQQRGKKEITFFDLLKQDHEKFKDIFGQLEEEGEESRPELFPELQSELQTHFQLEEKLFYPALEQSEEARKKALEAYEEHNVAKTVLGECANLEPNDERWAAKLKVLQEIVMHHVQKEEKEVFKTAKNVLEKEQIKQITDQIQQQKTGIEKKAA